MSENNFTPVRSVSSASTEPRGSKRPLEKEGASGRRINLNIAGPDGVVITYFVSVDTPLEKIFKRYCQDKHLEYLAMRFHDHMGRRVQVRRTAEELHIVDGDQIDGFVHSHSG